MRHLLLWTFAIALLISTLLAAGCNTHELRAAGGERKRAERQSESGEKDFSEREETRESYELAPGARVKVAGINGAVEIETTDGRMAEVHIVRSARRREALEQRKIVVEHTASSLVVRGEKSVDGHTRGIFAWILGKDADVRQHITLKLPRQIELSASGVNGPVHIGEIDGPVQISGVNGRVEVAQATGAASISGVNGRVKAVIKELGERGIDISGVNGRVELLFGNNLNAELHVSGVNGQIKADVPNVETQGEQRRGNLRARIGEGGHSIKVSGVNGQVQLGPA